MKLRFFLLVIVALVLLTGCERDATALLERAECIWTVSNRLRD